eukprot:NODE_872_length_1585_cov_79.227709_g861_i0.p1 GENE.NODE_872_length_1585_cov_79.227709_g861_i0~~NODE_872_length_1585_cov_79.227709_g861_i0.p1  ORF type:complete len:450 (+),score=44.98 NODE_872_length_1585_cov_79.227709_g861_i0:69-1418(+)
MRSAARLLHSGSAPRFNDRVVPYWHRWVFRSVTQADGRVYYYNQLSKESTWVLPKRPEIIVVPHGEPVPISRPMTAPELWVTAQDRSATDSTWVQDLPKPLTTEQAELVGAYVVEFGRQSFPPEEHLDRIMEVVTDLQEEIQTTLYPESVQLRIFGSLSANLANKDTDVDLCVLLMNEEKYGVGNAGLTKVQAKRLVKQLAEVPSLQGCQPVLHATVPVLPVPATPHTPALDLSFGYWGVLNSMFLRRYVEASPVVQPLLLFIKHWSKRVGINNSRNGMFNSYTVMLMALHFLARTSLSEVTLIPPPADVHTLTPQSLLDGRPTLSIVPPNRYEEVGQLLAQFFQFYAKFAFDREVVNLKSACCFNKPEAPFWDGYWIGVEDPLEHCFNTARTVSQVTAFKTIRAVFARSAEAIKTVEDIPTWLQQLEDERHGQPLQATRAPDAATLAG